MPHYPAITHAGGAQCPDKSRSVRFPLSRNEETQCFQSRKHWASGEARTRFELACDGFANRCLTAWLPRRGEAETGTLPGSDQVPEFPTNGQRCSLSGRGSGRGVRRHAGLGRSRGQSGHGRGERRVDPNKYASRARPSRGGWMWDNRRDNSSECCRYSRACVTTH